MIEKYNKHSLRELFIASLCALFIYLTSVYFIPFAFFIFPTPFIVLGIKRGMQHSILSILLTSAVIYLFEGISGALLMAGIGVLVAIPMIFCIRKSYSAFTTITVATGIGVVFVFLLSALVSQMNGIDIVKSLEAAVTRSINEQLVIMNDMNIIKMDDLDGAMNSSIAIMMAIIPSLLFIMTMLISMLNYYLSTSMLRRIGFGIIDVPKFRNFKLPSDIVVGVFITMVGTFILSKTGFQYSTELSLNLTLAFSFLFLLQGVAVAIKFLRNKINPVLLNVIIIVTLILNVRIVYVIIGAIYSALNSSLIIRRDDSDK